jgi:hypothetical protein
MSGSLNTPTAVVQELAGSLRPLLKVGLPIAPDCVSDALLELNGVTARSSDPHDRLCRVKVLDGLVRWQLAKFDNPELAEAARILFGLVPGAAGTTQTVRRQQAARVTGYELHHFRKRIEPKIVDLLAWQLHRDSQEHVPRSRAVAPQLVFSGADRRLLPADVFAWEAAEHGEAVSRLWSAVYALRADLFAIERLVSMESPQSDVTSACDSALWRAAVLLSTARQYHDAYGGRLLHSDTELAPGQLIRLAGWTPRLGMPEIDLIVDIVGNPEAGRPAFMERLLAAPAGGELIAGWRSDLSAGPGFGEAQAPRRSLP